MIKVIHLRNPSICGHASRCGSVAQNERCGQRAEEKMRSVETGFYCRFSCGLICRLQAFNFHVMICFRVSPAFLGARPKRARAGGMSFPKSPSGPSFHHLPPNRLKSHLMGRNSTRFPHWMWGFLLSFLGMPLSLQYSLFFFSSCSLSSFLPEDCFYQRFTGNTIIFTYLSALHLLGLKHDILCGMKNKTNRIHFVLFYNILSLNPYFCEQYGIRNQ